MELQKQLKAALEEIDRLKDALQEIANGANSTYEDAWCGEIAKEALSYKKVDHHGGREPSDAD